MSTGRDERLERVLGSIGCVRGGENLFRTYFFYSSYGQTLEFNVGERMMLFELLDLSLFLQCF